jgi:GxxExxY protein
VVSFLEALEFLAANRGSIMPIVKDRVFQLCDIVRRTAFEIHEYLGPGHLEKVYENALGNRLFKAGLKIEQQFPLAVFDQDGTCIGEYFADLFIEECLVVEMKAARTLADEHVAQILGYLRASKIEHGLLINFGATRFQIRKFVMSPRRPVQPPSDLTH